MRKPCVTDAPNPADEPVLQSAVFVPPGETLLRQAIAMTLDTPPEQRAIVFELQARQIEIIVSKTAPEHPWSCAVYTGTDGARIFRGGVGHSLVIDPQGRLWRARSYEDFETTYAFTDKTCSIATLAPLYSQMREYLPEPGKQAALRQQHGLPDAGFASNCISSSGE